MAKHLRNRGVDPLLRTKPQLKQPRMHENCDNHTMGLKQGMEHEQATVLIRTRK